MIIVSHQMDKMFMHLVFLIIFIFQIGKHQDIEQIVPSSGRRTQTRTDERSHDRHIQRERETGTQELYKNAITTKLLLVGIHRTSNDNVR